LFLVSTKEAGWTSKPAEGFRRRTVGQIIELNRKECCSFTRIADAFVKKDLYVLKMSESTQNEGN
jgi:hypothetical protein